VKIKYQLKDKSNFLPLYEIPTKIMRRLELKYQLKTELIEQNWSSSFSI